MKREDTSKIIGQRVEYQAGGQLYTGIVIDKVRILGRHEDAGREFDLYVIKTDTGMIYKVSPAAIIKIIQSLNP